MRSLFAAPGFLLLAACAAAPTPVATTRPPPVTPQASGALLGLTAEELVRRLGTPALQIREGASLKLQFRSPFCVLDAYLYPPVGAAAPYRVTDVDTRSPALAPVPAASCLASLQGA